MIIEKEVIARTEQKRSIETTAHSIKQVKCQQGRFRRRLFDVAVEGIFVPCKECRRAHLVTWEELAAWQQGFRPVLVHIEQVS